MSLVRGLIKSAIVVKAAQVAQRELSKPENQRKIKEGFEKVKEELAKRRSNPLPDELQPRQRTARGVALPTGRRAIVFSGVSSVKAPSHRELTPTCGLRGRSAYAGPPTDRT